MKVVNPFNILTEFDHWFAFEVKRSEGRAGILFSHDEQALMMIHLLGDLREVIIDASKATATKDCELQPPFHPEMPASRAAFYRSANSLSVFGEPSRCYFERLSFLWHSMYYRIGPWAMTGISGSDGIVTTHWQRAKRLCGFDVYPHMTFRQACRIIWITWFDRRITH